jgi:hypothetical protein
MKRLISFSLLIGALGAFSYGQTVSQGILLVNGGQFGNPLENVNVVFARDPAVPQRVLDTIQTESAQDLLIEGTEFYVAAQDSIVKYDLISGERLAAAAFGAPSTIAMERYGNYLLVGNWYAPFGAPGPYRNHFRIFDKNTLAFVDSIPEIKEGAKSFVVVGDTAYIAQNRTSAAFADTAGWLVRINLSTLTYIDSLVVNQNGEDLGNLVVKNGLIYGINSESNTLTVINPVNGAASTLPANANFQAGGYGSRLTLDEFGVLHTVIAGKIATYNLDTRSVINPSVVDTVITAFALDTVRDVYYVTQTDYFSYTQGGLYNFAGQKINSFTTGFSPEVIQVVYNVLPEAGRDTATIRRDETARVLVKANDRDPDGVILTTAIIEQPANGTAAFNGDTLVYTPNSGFIGTDSLWYDLLDAWGYSDTAWVVIDVLPAVRIDNLANQLGIRLFPNPASDRTVLTFGAPWSGEVRIASLNGQVLSTWSLQNTLETVLPLGNLPAGSYLLQGTGASGTWSRLLLVRN